MKQNKILLFAERQKAKSWTNFQIINVRASMDPTTPPMYIVDVQGQRGDGVVFTIPVVIDKTKYDLLPGAKALEIAAGLLNQGIRQLMTFTGCGCTSDSECEHHKKASVH